MYCKWFSVNVSILTLFIALVTKSHDPLSMGDAVGFLYLLYRSI